MIQLKMRAAMSAFALATLQACGGGGDSVVASSASFPISQALDSYVRDAKSSPVSITATVNGVPFAGSGTISESIATTTFEGVTAFQKSSTLAGTLSGFGQSIPISSTSASYFDANFKPLGKTDSAQYCVTTSTTPVPATARIGDSGNWVVYTCYTGSSKTVRLGTIAATYVLEPDTATTGILKISNLFSADIGGSFNATATLRLTTAGGLTRLSETALVSSVVITVTYP